MAIWHRIRSLSNLRRLSLSPPIPSPNSRAFPLHFALNFGPTRSFAAPVQVKSKPKGGVGESSGPRLNEAITGRMVRLVSDDGHSIVSLKEALDRAKKLDLDLVEVQRNVNPPVCKIMDFYKEKFKQDLKEKERAKSKSAVALKNGEVKEIRFKGKTELKDLKTKADQVTRLMERGHRVKCIAMPTGKEEEDLGGLLARLLTLISDVSIVESGPHVESTKAFIILRHSKFTTKKSGKKISQIMDEVLEGAKGSSVNKGGDPADVEQDQVDSSEDEDNTNFNQADSPKVENSRGPLQERSSLAVNQVRGSKPGLGSVIDKLPNEPSIVEPNRYSKQTQTMGRSHQSNMSDRNNVAPYNRPGANQGRMPLVQSGSDNQGRDQLSPIQRQFNPNTHNPQVARPGGQRDSVGTGSRSSEMPMKRQSNPNTQTTQTARPGVHRGPIASGNRSSEAPKLGIFTNNLREETTNSANPTSPKSKYGIFSSDKPPMSSNNKLVDDAAKPHTTATSAPKYGIFSVQKNASPGN